MPGGWGGGGGAEGGKVEIDCRREGMEERKQTRTIMREGNGKRGWSNAITS